MAVPLLDLKRQYASLEAEIEPDLRRLLRSQQFILGPEVEAFENELKTACGAPHCVGVSSGTDGQLAILMALGWGEGDAVILPPFTFFATAGGLHRLGIEPLFCDIDPVSFNLDPVALQALLSLLPRKQGRPVSPRGNVIRAVLPVHLFGQCADMERIGRLAEEHDCRVIEDAAQAIGAWQGERQAGSLGLASWFSFFPSKNLGAFGDGGAVTCLNGDLAERIRSIRNHGMTRTYHHELVGGNFRLAALQALVLRKKLPHLAEWTSKRREHAAFYTQYWESEGVADRIQAPREVNHSTDGPAHIYHQYVIRTPERDALKAKLDGEGIGNAIYYPIPLHLQECFRSLGYREGDFPVSEQACREVLALPVFPELTEVERLEVAEAVVRFARQLD